MSIVLRGGSVWDGVTEGRREASVVIDGERIGLVGNDGAGPETLDISGCTIIPGLIEGHAHLCFNAATNWREVYDSDTPGRMLLRMATNGQAMLRAGMTTVRDLGAPTELAIELREAIASGLTAGPTLLVAGAPITTTGGHCWFMGGEADGEIELRKAVRARLKAGCDWIKVMATGGNMTRRTNTFAAQYTVEELAAVVGEARRLRRKVTAHAHGTEGIRVAVDAGVDMIEHCSFSDPGGIAVDETVLEKMVAQGTVVSPTVSSGYRRWPDDGRREQRGKIMRALFDSGCRVVMSTDCGIPGVPHHELAGGMAVLSELARLTAEETLQLATSKAAELLDLPDRGVIAPGKRADLVVVDGDPTTDLATLTRVRAVIQAGAVVYRAPS